FAASCADWKSLLLVRKKPLVRRRYFLRRALRLVPRFTRAMVSLLLAVEMRARAKRTGASPLQAGLHLHGVFKWDRHSCLSFEVNAGRKRASVPARQTRMSVLPRSRPAGPPWRELRCLAQPIAPMLRDRNSRRTATSGAPWGRRKRPPASAFS